ncbi:MAG TPA: hypothetical protein VH142_12025, partial [Polyangiaceae bacterium]|nr:hypothetical protein [Polyangiaceae bacterium]
MASSMQVALNRLLFLALLAMGVGAALVAFASGSTVGASPWSALAALAASTFREEPWALAARASAFAVLAAVVLGGVST